MTVSRPKPPVCIVDDEWIPAGDDIKAQFWSNSGLIALANTAIGTTVENIDTILGHQAWTAFRDGLLNSNLELTIYVRNTYLVYPFADFILARFNVEHQHAHHAQTLKHDMRARLTDDQYSLFTCAELSQANFFEFVDRKTQAVWRCRDGLL